MFVANVPRLSEVSNVDVDVVTSPGNMLFRVDRDIRHRYTCKF